MTDATPITTRAPGKRKAIPNPGKPWEGFPLYWHPRGYWMIRKNGREWRYTADPHESHRRYTLDMEALRTGAERQAQPARYFLRDAINLYLTRQKRRHDEGEISDAQFARCRLELETKLPKAAKLTTPLAAFRQADPGDHGPAQLFGSIRRAAIARGLDAAHKHIVIVRAALDYAASKKYMLPPDYGDDFDPPSQRAIDKKRRERDDATGERAWSVDELRKMLSEAKSRADEQRRAKTKKNLIRSNPHIYAQILLALFGGFGSDDLSAMKESSLDRERGIIRHHRAKTGRPCVCAIPAVVWAAIDASIAARKPAATDEAKGLLFRSDKGRRCNAAENETDEKGVKRVGRNDTIGKNFQRFIKRIGLHKRRAGFKTLRAMCRTLLTTSGVDDDIRRVIMGRKFRLPVDEYYLRGDLRGELVAASKHIEAQLFPKQTQSRRKK